MWLLVKVIITFPAPLRGRVFLLNKNRNQNDSTIKFQLAQWWLADVFVHLSLLTTNDVIHNITKIIE
jgi:hypothetical protein